MKANYKVETASGIFLLLGLGALLWLSTQATDFGNELGEDSYTITARFTATVSRCWQSGGRRIR